MDLYPAIYIELNEINSFALMCPSRTNKLENLESNFVPIVKKKICDCNCSCIGGIYFPNINKRDETAITTSTDI